MKHISTSIVSITTLNNIIVTMKIFDAITLTILYEVTKILIILLKTKK